MSTEYPPLSKTKAALYTRLVNVKIRRKENLFMVVGEKCVADTRDTFKPECIIATKEWIERNHSDWPEEIIRLGTESELSKLSGMNSSPQVIAIYNIPENSEQNLTIPVGDLALLLDGVRDPGNFGSIMRTADWFGISRIFASKDSADLYNPKVIQATMGAISRVRIIYCDLTDVVKANPTLPVYGTMLEGKDIYKTELLENAIIVMGNEGQGLSREMRELVTKPILIPPYNPLSHGESLNVGAATAVTLAAFRFHK